MAVVPPNVRLVLADDGSSEVPVTLRTKRLLKLLQKSFGLRCISAEVVPPGGAGIVLWGASDGPVGDGEDEGRDPQPPAGGG
jgi:hypothetical protein